MLYVSMAKTLPSKAYLRRVCGRMYKAGMMPIPSKFLLHSFSITPGADKALSGSEIACAVSLHGQGDWGSVSKGMWARNNRSMNIGGTVLSRYRNFEGTEFHVLTELDYAMTWVFLPREKRMYLSKKSFSKGTSTGHQDLQKRKTRELSRSG